jgi:hypothetical protein
VVFNLFSIPQVLSCREDLFCLFSLHGRPQLEGKNIEELITAIAAMHNIIRAGGEEVIPTFDSTQRATTRYRSSWLV